MLGEDANIRSFVEVEHEATDHRNRDANGETEQVSLCSMCETWKEGILR